MTADSRNNTKAESQKIVHYNVELMIKVVVCLPTNVKGVATKEECYLRTDLNGKCIRRERGRT